MRRAWFMVRRCLPSFGIGYGIFWFRVWRYGPGLHFKRATEPLIFSERYGHRKYVTMLRCVRIGYLTSCYAYGAKLEGLKP